MSQDTLIGQLIEPAEGPKQRDAVHIAVAPVIAACKLKPGQRIGFCKGSTERVTYLPDKGFIGIVDPFLMAPAVLKDDQFWMFLLPRTITSLRHNWTHPAFPVTIMTGSLDEERAIHWITEFADVINQPYDQLMAAAHLYATTGDYTSADNNESYNDVAHSRWQLFWHYYRILTGEGPVDPDTGAFFSCAC